MDLDLLLPTLQVSLPQSAFQKQPGQTAPMGARLGLGHRILLVPPALEVAADVLYNSLEVRDMSASTKYGTHNPFKGRFKPLMSSYLLSSILAGNCSTAWHVLVDPRDVATIEVVFLNGVEIPTADLDLNVLGIQIRGIHDFGVEKQEYRGGVKSKGAA